jgi:hypothetical protein
MILPFREHFEKIFSGQAKWHIKYFWFLLFFIIIFLNVTLIFYRQNGPVPKWKPLSWGLFFLFFSTSLFWFFQAGEKCKKIKNWLFKILLFLLIGIFFLVWILVVCGWLISLFGF